jgi:CRP-like cAMP-binding protein
MSAFASGRRPTGRWTTISLLEADPDLGRGLTEPRLAEATEALVVRRLASSAVAWTDDALARIGAGGPGLLVLDGILARELVMSDNVTTELLGAGDLVRSAHTDDPSRLLRSSVRWTVLETPAFAVLGADVTGRLALYPEIYAELIDRLAVRAHRLTVAQAISQLNGVDRRVLTLFWHLAERWGHVRPDGVAVPLCLPHRIVAQLVGARRPTVSTALGALVRDGSLARLDDGGWLLRGEPVGLPVGEAGRAVRTRRRRFPGRTSVAA